MVAKPAALARIRSLLNNGSTVAIFTPLRRQSLENARPVPLTRRSPPG
jgi:hypothetical protein